MGICCIDVLSIIGCSNWERIPVEVCAKYYLHNTSNYDVVVVTPYSPVTLAYDSIILKNGDYYLLEAITSSNNKINGHDNLNNKCPLYIYLNDIRYQVDRNDDNACVWARSYREATKEEENVFMEKDIDWIRVYGLTETNIKS